MNLTSKYLNLIILSNNILPFYEFSILNIKTNLETNFYKKAKVYLHKQK